MRNAIHTGKGTTQIHGGVQQRSNKKRDVTQIGCKMRHLNLASRKPGIRLIVPLFLIALFVVPVTPVCAKESEKQDLERVSNYDFDGGFSEFGNGGEWNEYNFWRTEKRNEKERTRVVHCRRGYDMPGAVNYGYGNHTCGTGQSIIPCPRPGSTYTFKARARLTEPLTQGAAPRRIFVEFTTKADKRVVGAEFHVTKTEYEEFSKTFTVPADVMWCRVWILYSAGAGASHKEQFGNFYVDWVSLKPTGPAPALAAPWSFRATQCGSTMVRLAWDAVRGAAGYEIQRKDSKGAYKTVIKTIEGGTSTSFLDAIDINGSSPLIQGATYDYRIRALGDGANSSYVEAKGIQLVKRKTSPGNTTYYISSTHGNDKNSGTSSSEAWKSFVPLDCLDLAPGDKVYLRRGDNWLEPMNLHGKGAKGREILVAGTGDSDAPRPIIQAGTLTHAAVRLIDSSHFIVKDLEVSNWHPCHRQFYRYGFEIGAWEADKVENITVENVFINRVRSVANRGRDGVGENKSGSGFRVMSYLRKGHKAIKAASLKGKEERNSKVRGLTIRNCTLFDIEMFAFHLIDLQDSLITRNKVDWSGYCGLLSSKLYNTKISYNEFKRAGVYVTHCDNAHIGMYGGENCVLEHNVVDTTYYDSGQSMNFDTTKGYIIQYNYLKDSVAGSFVFNHGAPDNIVRYNICEGLRREWLRNLGGVRTQVYNNTVYFKEGEKAKLAANRLTVSKAATPVDGLLLCNNVFYNAEGLNSEESELHPTTKNAKDILTTHNVYYKASDDDFRDLKDAAPVFADPLFRGPVGEGKPAAYELKPDSPCIGAGKVVKDNGGKDFFGNPVPANAPPAMGAFQGTQ